MRVVIVASGPTAKGFVPPEDVTVIAVNGAIDWVSRADYFFTLDPSLNNLARLNCQRQGVNYCYGYSQPLKLNGNANARFYLRVGDTPFANPAAGSPQWWANRWGCKLGLCKTPGEIHTGNSAWGALAMAYHLGAKRVALVGVDASAEPRVEGGIPNELCHLPLLFNSALGQINVVNCGAMKCDLPKLSIETAMEWLCA